MILNGLLGIYQEILHDGKILYEYPMWTGHLLRGFSVAIRICHLAPFTATQNNLFITSLLDFGRTLFDNLWIARKLLLTDIPRVNELFGDMKRGIASVVLAYVDLCSERECMPTLREWKAGHLAMFCWFHMPEDEGETDLKKLFMDTMHLSCQAGTQYERLDEFVRTVIVPEFSAKGFLQRINRDLKNPDIVHARLMPVLFSGCAWMRNKVFGPLFNEVGTYEAVAEAWKRQVQLETSPGNQWFFLRDVMPFLGLVLLCVFARQ
ncbi:hypothetical protein OF83DRAFT_1168300 [Amylostereum chailletii]|nr:hypothetical protein OF83DRAFT_1168300 [Amylostereum chailletii]